MKWNPSLYDEKHGFVAEYGKSLLELIPQNPDQTILDLGCGTGALTRQLLPLASRVAGADSSPDMIRQAQAQNPGTEFLVCDALDLPFREEWDVVFSNAVFHWIGDHDALLGSIRRAGRCCGQGAPVCILLPKSNRFESRTKVETLPKSKGNPLPESRMILREKISGKVELGLYYALLFHDSGVYPVFLLIPHAVLLQTMVFQPKSDRVQGFAADKVGHV